MLYIDIHTHKPSFSLGKSILSRYDEFEQVAFPGNYSIGLHPWHIDAFYWEEQWISLVKWSSNIQVLAIGECGLDAVCSTPMDIQRQLFKAQIALSERIKKPLVIHCVGAWEEVLRLLAKQSLKIPVIFHGFNKKKALATRVMEAGYYLSFGKSLEKISSREVLVSLPPDKIFLETDDAAIDIETIYGWASQAMGIDINSLSLQIQKNAAVVFGSSFAEL